MNAALEWKELNNIALFKEFYCRVRHVKSMIMQGAIDWPSITDEDIPANLSERESTRLLSSYLRAALASQTEYVASHTSQLEFAAYRDASYLMCALADEIFLIQLNWFGRRYWHEFSLESGAFSTAIAGDEYYRRLQTLLKKDVLSYFEKQLAALFILTLQLGFRGRIRGNEKLVKTLLDRLLPKTGVPKQTPHLFPAAYGSIVNPTSAARLEPFSRWHKIIFWSLISYLILTSGVWLWISTSFFLGLSE